MTPASQSALHALFQKGVDEGFLYGAVLSTGRTTGEQTTVALGEAVRDPASRPMTPDAIFDIASVTKVVATTAACARCLDLGLLDFEAPVTRYLPHLGQLPGQPITVRDLATHVSGYDNSKVRHLTPGDAYEALVTQPPKWPPRTQFLYACRNFILLGRIVEQVTGQSLDAFCARQIFEPLGMTDTRFGPLPAPGPRVVPTCVAPGIPSDQQARHLQRPVGNAGVFSCAQDLGKFCRAVLSDLRDSRGILFQKTSLAWMRNPCSPPGLPLRAFGWDMRPRSEVPHRPSSFSPASIGHSGWTGQSLWIDPEQDRYLLVMTNRTTVPGCEATHATQMVLRGELADQFLAGQE